MKWRWPWGKREAVARAEAEKAACVRECERLREQVVALRMQVYALQAERNRRDVLEVFGCKEGSGE